MCFNSRNHKLLLKRAGSGIVRVKETAKRRRKSSTHTFSTLSLQKPSNIVQMVVECFLEKPQIRMHFKKKNHTTMRVSLINFDMVIDAPPKMCLKKHWAVEKNENAS